MNKHFLIILLLLIPISFSTTHTFDSISVPSGYYKTGDEITVDLTFSENVTRPTTISATIGGVTIRGPYRFNTTNTSRAIHQINLTVPSGLTDGNNQIRITASGFLDSSSTAGTQTTRSTSVNIDTSKPRFLGFNVPSTTFKVGSTVRVDLRFSEDVQLANGNLQIAIDTSTTIRPNIISSNMASQHDIEFIIPNTITGNGTKPISITASGFLDRAGNSGDSTPFGENINIDATLPTFDSITVPTGTYKTGIEITVDLVFSEPVLRPTAISSVSIGGVSIAGPYEFITPDGLLQTHELNLTVPTIVGNGSRVVSISASGFSDAVANSGNGATRTDNIMIDNTAPTFNSISVPTGSYKTNDEITIDLRFSEPVTRPTINIFTIGGVTISGPYTFNTTNILRDIHQINLTVPSGLTDGNNVISVTASNYVDGVVNSGTNNVNNVDNIVIDNTAPTFNNISVPTGSYKTNDEATINLTFNGPVTTPTIVATIGSQTAVVEILTTGSRSQHQINLTIPHGLHSESNSVSITASNYADGAGNGGNSVAHTGNIIIDNIPPTLTLLHVDSDGNEITIPTQYGRDDTLRFTATFAEDIMNIDDGDIRFLYTNGEFFENNSVNDLVSYNFGNKISTVKISDNVYNISYVIGNNVNTGTGISAKGIYVDINFHDNAGNNNDVSNLFEDITIDSLPPVITLENEDGTALNVASDIDISQGQNYTYYVKVVDDNIADNPVLDITTDITNTVENAKITNITTFNSETDRFKVDIIVAPTKTVATNIELSHDFIDALNNPAVQLNKNLDIINAMVLTSISTDNDDGKYGIGDDINIIATFDANIGRDGNDLDGVPTLVLKLNTGEEVELTTLSDSNDKVISGVYTISRNGSSVNLLNVTEIVEVIEIENGSISFTKENSLAYFSSIDNFKEKSTEVRTVYNAPSVRIRSSSDEENATNETSEVANESQELNESSENTSSSNPINGINGTIGNIIEMIVGFINNLYKITVGPIIGNI